ncbi:class I SAM-dependent methyltransferase [Belliella sp. DSM 111904]|uniref:Class I SAM-dependent methyltransferase n=1 Tax=Belliella filtrata TaxID=2923435 RepID=A0ABS9V4T2_9BACT|nr:class I SAM-dependent methyltransferase [Belliella filtrata]MCH7411411.1 class I SAM-dependent methyltransferase [Belliella filtrata]
MSLFQKSHQIIAFFSYWLNQEDKYAIQSPSVFEIYTGLLHFFKKNKNIDLEIEKYRSILLQDHQELEIEDYGAGSIHLKKNLRKTSAITKYSTSTRKYAQLYQYFCQLTPAQQVLELGTCVGLTTRYLSKVTKGKLFTIEGSSALWHKAQSYQTHSNTTFLLGEIEKTLPVLLSSIEKLDFALIDATHTYQATLSYIKQIIPYTRHDSILIVADIHWSSSMEKAWEQIKQLPEVSLTLDFYEAGVVFLNPKLPKEDFVLKI